MDKKIKVLMVDDETQFRATTEKILRRRGFETILAESGEEAIEKLSDNPDVVILDIKMPGMDGHEALKEIKKRSPALPVIMLTGHGAMPSAEEALVEGAYDYLSKPCDIDLLSGKIADAYAHVNINALPKEEKLVADAMIPIPEYTTLNRGNTVKEAIEKLRESFTAKISTSRIMETGHRSLLVMDEAGQVAGIVAITDLLEAVMPGYLSAPKPSLADSMQYSPMFWTGLFTRQVELLSHKKIHEIMSPPPMAIDADANLMEAAYSMVADKERRLVVEKEGTAIGIIREQDLFFEIEKILRS
jgi:CheY-like chemotaxis protein